MTIQAASTVTGIISVTQLAVCADLIHEYLRTPSQKTSIASAIGFPSGDVRTALIVALITATWGVVVAAVVSVVRQRGIWTGDYVNAMKAASYWSLLTFVLDMISGGLLAKASPHGCACIVKTAKTCHLFVAAVVLEWIMAALNLIITLFAAQAVKYHYAINAAHMHAEY